MRVCDDFSKGRVLYTPFFIGFNLDNFVEEAPVLPWLVPSETN